LPSDDYADNLKKSIAQSGFPLELEIEAELRDRKWYTHPSFYYMDPDENKPREVDNYALFPNGLELDRRFSPLGISPHLLVECKKLDDVSAVVFRRHKMALTHYDFEGQMYDFPSLIERRPFPDLVKEFHLGSFLGRCSFHYNAFIENIGNCRGLKPGAKMSTSPNEKWRDPVYESLIQLAKAQGYDVATSIERDKEITNPYYPLYFGFLVLVVDGRVFEVDRTGDSILLQPTGHSVARVSYKPTYSDRILDYLVDVVKKEHFGDYLETLTSDYSRLQKTILADKDGITGYLRRRPVRDHS